MTNRIDEPVTVVPYDPSWVDWCRHDAEELTAGFGSRLKEVAHSGSTSVPGLAAKPMIDVLVAPASWPLVEADRITFETLGYEYLGEAGAAGREYFRRRREHNTNLAVVEWQGTLWLDNLLLRDYLRAHTDVSAQYAELKNEVWRNGARTLLAYSEHKRQCMEELFTAARRWKTG